MYDQNHRWSWHGITTHFLTFCLHIYLQSNFFIISFLYPLFIVFMSRYPYNLIVTATCICRSYAPLLSTGRRPWHVITPPLFYFLFTYLFSITFLYYFTSFSWFSLFVSIFIQSYVNNNLHVSTIHTVIIHVLYTYVTILKKENS